jgi:predicted phosphodiesterase
MSVYCASDLHGDYKLWKEIQNYLKEEDILIYLGDAMDRGGRGFEIYIEMLKDSRVIYLLGNHETLMYSALLAAYPKASKDWYKNGGEATILNLREVKEKNNWDFFDDVLPLVKKIANMNFLMMYENANGTKFFLSHAGFTPTNQFFSLDLFEQEQHLTWNRQHFSDTWPEGFDDCVVIHGHTPVQYLKKQYSPSNAINITESNPYLVYANGHKICLDGGTIISNEIALWNLDTNKLEKIFK